MTNIDIDYLRGWIGKTRENADEISPRLSSSLAAILDESVNLPVGSEAPVGIHWCLSPDIVAMSGLGPDGHPQRGGFLPPVPFPRRMWAGGELRFHGDFRSGDAVTRRSRIDDVVLKEGKTGALCFVTVTHDYYTGRGLALSERHDIVYREVDAKGSAPAPLTGPDAPADEQFSIEGTPTLLMRYSAVTFNGHRIHYDRNYCVREERYPGLVVHGPLQATYMLRLATKMNGGRLPSVFSFRGVRPLFDGTTFTINGRSDIEGAMTLWVSGADGLTTMTAAAKG